jgi:uncharacterized damage-inducible protein DinB
MLPDQARRYLLHGLAATPVVVDRLLRDAEPADYDRRPDPERFTLREVIAHLADWEPIWLERLQKIRTENQPTLPSYDEGQMAIDHDYAHADVGEQQARFREGRARLLQFLQELSPAEWERSGLHTQWGALSIETLAVLVHGHDGYHLRQIAEWLGHSTGASS